MRLPLMALFGRHNRTQECLLLGEERKSRLRRLTSESDPTADNLQAQKVLSHADVRDGPDEFPAASRMTR